MYRTGLKEPEGDRQTVMKQIENKTLRTLAEYGLITFSIWIMVVGI